MQSKPLEHLRQNRDDESKAWHSQYIRNALGMLGQIKTEDRTLAEHLLTAEQALRKATSYLDGAN